MSRPDPQGDAAAVAAALRTKLESLRDAGAIELPRIRIAPAATSRAGKPDEAVVKEAKTEPVAAAGDPAAGLVLVREDLGDCRRCKLAGTRTQIVFGVGNPRAEVMFVGEGPGEEEDRRGEPFVGRAGQLLTDIITKGMGMSRAEVYIANVVKCRPPGNRNPEPDEVAACSPFLERQIETIGPKVLVALGKFATQLLLGGEVSITKVRGQWREHRGRRVMPTFHPSYLLRNPSAKREVWLDVQEILRVLGRPVPGAKPAGG